MKYLPTMRYTLKSGEVLESSEDEITFSTEQFGKIWKDLVEEEEKRGGYFWIDRVFKRFRDLGYLRPGIKDRELFKKEMGL